ncbi:putative regulatory protein, ArsR family [Nocardioides sp. OK12]|uniref:arsenate reductase/protein-tyrosine-phosphatase family protein n=1 Tax=Nocardioides sp. OK12 TaxID=2758661 RepID=UPI0021C2B1E7|nr:helix-turn-helix domain-containing protein [Nocardioides sp. OK12]GHJ59846.1 putative regulatory protein, ArsR family [Nocardioides sp. OK12]
MNVEAIGDGVLERRVARHAALADAARLRVVDLLVLGDASPGELRAALGLSSNLLAHHLGVLERAGLVTRHVSQADRRRSYVSLEVRALDDLAPTGGRGGVEARRVVFVCTANSARSQLAAALWNTTGTVPGLSAGTHPADRVAPGARAAARRRGLRLADEPVRLADVAAPGDLLVTVCDRAHEELAPGTPTGPHWSVPDPVPVGTDAAFDDAAAEIERRVARLATHLGPEHRRPQESP